MSKEIGKENVFPTPSEFKCLCATQVGIKRVNSLNKTAFRDTEAEVNPNSRHKKNWKQNSPKRRRAELWSQFWRGHLWSVPSLIYAANNAALEVRPAWWMDTFFLRPGPSPLWKRRNNKKLIKKKKSKGTLDVFAPTCSFQPFEELAPTPCLFFFSIYEAAPFPSGNYLPQSCVHASDDTDKTWQPQLGREPVFMLKYAARGQAKSARADRKSSKFESSPF